MNTTGSVTFGGYGFAAVVADITTEDGHKYHFKGYIGEIGTPQVGYGTTFSGDLHGQIGTLVGQVFGGGFDIGMGGGSWNDEEWASAQKKKRR